MSFCRRGIISLGRLSKLLGASPSLCESRRRFHRYEVYDDKLFSARDAPSIHMTIHPLCPGRRLWDLRHFVDDH